MSDKPGIMLVHGFWAGAAHWAKGRQSMGSACSTSRRYLAPSSGWNPVPARPGAYPMSCRTAAAISRPVFRPRTGARVLAVLAARCRR
jgi:hypothetical protein